MTNSDNSTPDNKAPDNKNPDSQASGSQASEIQFSDNETLHSDKLKNVLEAALMAVAKPMNIDQIMKLFGEDERPSVNQVKDALAQLKAECEGRGVELKEIASGYRYQSRQEYSEWLSRLWEEKPSRYSRAFLETLALIAYRQPVTRAEIEDVRGVAVSSNIIRSMLEREFVRVVGHRDVPGRPSLYATTKEFLDYFNMKSLEELPSLSEIKDLDELNPELELSEPGEYLAEIEAAQKRASELKPKADIDADLDENQKVTDSANQEVSDNEELSANETPSDEDSLEQGSLNEDSQEQSDLNEGDLDQTSLNEAAQTTPESLSEEESLRALEEEQLSEENLVDSFSEKDLQPVNE